MTAEDATPLAQDWIGRDLADLSVEDLSARIDALRAEITRTSDELQARRASRAAADAVFGNG